MRAALVVAAALALGGCSFKLDILGDPEPDRCPGTELDYCVPPGVSIRVAEGYTDLEAGTDAVLARDGVVPIWIDDGGSDDELDYEVSGGEVVSEEARRLVVRALEETITVHAEIGGQDDDLVVTSIPVDSIRVAPIEQQFLLAELEGPVEFAVVRGSVVPIVLQLVGGDERLIDTSLVARGAAVASHSRWDFVELDGAADPIALSIAGDSAAVDVEIAGVDPVLDAIEVVSGPSLSDPGQPITLSPAGEAAICFTGVAGGRQIAGLEWTLDGAGVDRNDGCAYVDRFTSSLSVSAGGITRTFDLEFVDP